MIWSDGLSFPLIRWPRRRVYINDQGYDQDVLVLKHVENANNYAWGDICT